MKIIKKIILALTIVATVFNLVPNLQTIPVYAAEKCITCETVDMTYYHTEPYKDSNTIVTVPEGTLLYVTGSTENELGHVWFEVNYFGKTVYVFSDHVKEHTHVYDRYTESSDTYACACGDLENCSDGICSTFLPAILASGAALSSEELAALGLAVGGAYAASKIPWETVIMVGHRVVNGIVVPIKITSSGFIECISSSELEDIENSQDDNYVKYYPTKLLVKDETDSVLLKDFLHPLNIDEASDYIIGMMGANSAACFGNFNVFQNSIASYCNIYTTEKDDARDLANHTVQNSPDLTYYGDDSGKCGQIAQNKRNNVDASYLHFHLFRKYGGVRDKAVFHILFGDRLGYTPTT